jgi:hypothetical protein
MPFMFFDEEDEADSRHGGSSKTISPLKLVGRKGTFW